MSDSLWPHGLYSPWSSPGQNTRVSSLFLLQGIFPTQGLNPGLPLCRRILYQLSHQGSPRIQEWVAYPFSSRSSWPRNRTGGLLHWRRILYQLSYEGNPQSKFTCLLLPTSHALAKKARTSLDAFPSFLPGTPGLDWVPVPPRWWQLPFIVSWQQTSLPESARVSQKMCSFLRQFPRLWKSTG